MLREIDLNESSDGKLYSVNDLVKAGCNDCVGCSACCRGMGDSIILDPLDIHNLTVGLGKTFEDLMEGGSIALRVVDGLILPHLNMIGEEEKCSFLNEEGRCKIHSFRPGFCRLFPLGRVYDEEGFRYFLQVNECTYKNRTKVKVKKWIDVPEIGKYEQFVIDWHFFQKEWQEELNSCEDLEARKQVSMLILREFYQKPYGKEDFYEEFGERLKAFP